MIFSVLSPLAAGLAKKSTSATVVRAGLSTKAAQVDPTKIHLYKSNHDERETWHHTPFAEREAPKAKPQPKAKAAMGEKQAPYYRKFMRGTSGNKHAPESEGMGMHGTSQGGGKITSL
ncbi:expressed unknown protein [Seminavis robusta]|uniref:Uncharacterized protein n=1 Tax=Seminavis robusta TaxID=568900 RepID=A0A9N8E665_9STRA|nr:expressed unknown protein [Seminavis robusta]|eukprot:Sro662_g183390.1 n/a (118) ;mRNA; f:33279-33736